MKIYDVFNDLEGVLETLRADIDNEVNDAVKTFLF